MFKATLEFFNDPNVEMGMKAGAALMLVLLSGFAWMLLKRFLPALGKPYHWYKERQAWNDVARREQWVTAVTRKFSGLDEGHPWRMRAHVRGAWIADEDDDSSPPTQAQWEMKNGAWSGRVLVIPKALDDAAQKRAAESSGAGDVANLALAAAGIVGVLAGQGWGGAVLDWAGSNTGELKSSGLDAVSVGSAGFQSAHVVRTDSPDLARRMITQEAEPLLAQLRDDADPENPFIVELAGGKFSMRHLGDFSNAERAAVFCKLGLAMTSGLAA